MINKQLINLSSPASGGGNQEQGLILHLDANDVDSYDGDGNVWYDISTHEVTVPLSDNADDLEFHINPSDSTSYGGTGNTITDLAGSATVTKDSGIDFDKDNGGYFDKTSAEGITTNYSPDNLTEFTAELWINPDSGSQNVSTLLTVTNSFNNNSLLIMYLRANQRQIQFSTYENDSTFVRWNPTGDTSVVYDKWQHLVMTCKNGGNMVIYLDGEVKQTLSFPNTMNTSVANLEIGHIPSNSSYGFNGQMGAVRFYSKQLSASEVGQNYRHGRDYVYTDLIDDTDLALHFDAADLTSAANTTWTDKVASLALTKNGTVNYDDELGDFIDFGGGYYGNDTATTTIKDSNADFTIEFWYNFDAFSGSNALLGIMQDASNRGLLMYFDGSTMDVYNYKNGTMGGSQWTSQSFSTLGISAGKWYHIVHVIDASASIKTYVDGELKATSTSNAGGSHWTAMDGIRIGDMETLSYGIDGKMGQFRIYKGLLTADEVRQNFNFTKNDYPNGINASLINVSWAADYFEIDSTSDVIEFGNGLKSYLDGLTTAISTSYWVRFDDLNATQVLLSYYNSSLGSASSSMVQWMRSSGKLSYYIAPSSGSTFADTSSVCVTANTWHHVVFILDMSKAQTNGTGGRVQVFVDGTEQSMSYNDSNGSTTMKTGSSSLKPAFGFSTNSSGVKENFFDGRVSKIKIYDKALTQAEVTALEAEGSGN